MTGFSSALVTGAGGFIGQSLVRRLTAMGVATACVARPSSVRNPAARIVPVADFTAASLSAALREETVDIVFNLAAYGVHPAEREPDLMAQVNVLAPAAICAAMAGRTRAVVHTGTCSEYANAPDGEKLTEASPLGSQALYGASKAAGGLYACAIAHLHGVNLVWLRLFGTYGPGEGPHRLPSYLIERLAANRSVDLTPGGQMRDFLYIDDVVDGLIAAGEAALASGSGVFNLCSGQPVAVKDLAVLVARHLGKSETLLHFGAQPYRPDEPIWVVGDNGRFGRQTGWKPRVALEDGIDRLIGHRMGRSGAPGGS